MPDYYVYIMSNPSLTLYAGVTNDLQRRVGEHKSGLSPGFTRRYRVNRLVYYEHTPSREGAIAREKQVKGWVRRRKVALIESVNPSWRDLSDAWLQATPRDPSPRQAGTQDDTRGITRSP